MSQDFVAILEFDAKHGVRQRLDNGALKHNGVFFRLGQGGLLNSGGQNRPRRRLRARRLRWGRGAMLPPMFGNAKPQSTDPTEKCIKRRPSERGCTSGHTTRWMNRTTAAPTATNKTMPPVLMTTPTTNTAISSRMIASPIRTAPSAGNVSSPDRGGANAATTANPITIRPASRRKSVRWNRAAQRSRRH